MTDQEQYQIIGKVVSDHEQAKKRLAALVAKAKTVGEELHAIANVLTQNADCTFDGETFVTKNRNNGQRTTASLPSFGAVHELVMDIETTRATIADLEARRRDMGIS